MVESVALKDSYLETRIFQARLLALIAGMLIMFFFLVARYFNLQIIRHEDFATRADSNRILSQTIPPLRGLIKDRNGALLADNIPSFSLDIVRERTENLEQTLQDLQAVIPISPEHIETFYKKVERGRTRPYQAIPLRYHLNDEEIAKIAINEWNLPGVEVNAQLIRHYPLNELTAHNVGYMGSINDKDIKNLIKQEQWKNYEGVVYSIGKLGIEKVYEESLFGVGGTRKVEVNARGRVLREITKEAPQAGNNLTLFLDGDLQKLIADKLKGQRAAVVAIETQTGGVVAAVSTPSFNPNLFVTGISSKAYNGLRDDWQLPLFNRLLQGQYPPASTLKPLMGLAGLESNVITSKFYISDPGYFQLPNDDHLYRDWKRGGHGKRINLRKAIAQSCDTFFYTLGVNLGIDRISPFFKEFGLGEKTGIDLTYERSGILPSRQWRKKRDGRFWYPGDTVNVSIGQGDMLTTPMQLAYMTSIIANRGKRITPRMVSKINEQETSPQILPPIVFSQEKNWQHVIDGMTDVVHSPTGTAHRLSKKTHYRMAGKTGTAQVVGIKQDEKYDRETLALRNRDHALFIAFAPIDNPQIAVAVIVENGEHGSSTAAPIAKVLIDAYLQKNPL